MIFRQLSDPETCTYTYLLGDEASGQAVLIDPVLSQASRDCQVLRELGLALTHTIETHVHADHVTGAAALRQTCGSRIVSPQAGGATGADLLIEDGTVLTLGSVSLLARATPGHTTGCTSFILGDESMVFTGDALLIQGCGRTDFQQGDSTKLYHSVTEVLFALPEDCVVYPGHDYKGRQSSTIGEEKRHNPRLGGGRTLEEFIEIMHLLDLSLPAAIAIAIPANLRCGQMPEDGEPA